MQNVGYVLRKEDHASCMQWAPASGTLYPFMQIFVEELTVLQLTLLVHG